MPDFDPEDIQRRAALAARKDALFTSQEAVAYDRGVVREFDKVSSEERAHDVQEQVMPNVPSSENDPTVRAFDKQGRAG
jgi:hypothetical protein